MVEALKVLGVQLTEDWANSRLVVTGCAGRFPGERCCVRWGVLAVHVSRAARDSWTAAWWPPAVGWRRPWWAVNTCRCCLAVLACCSREVLLA